MRYRLRTLLIAVAIGPPLLAALWWWLPMVPLNVRVFGHLIGIHVWVAIAALSGAVCVKCLRWWFQPVRD